jgi:hypothetical protein
MTNEQVKKYVGDVHEMSTDELNAELYNLIEWEGEHGTAEPRIDEITMELLMRDLMLDPDSVIGLEIDEEEFTFVDAKPEEESHGC